MSRTKDHFEKRAEELGLDIELTDETVNAITEADCKTFYALAIEDGGTYSLIDASSLAWEIGRSNNHFTTLEQARDARKKEDCPEAISIIKIQVIE